MLPGLFALQIFNGAGELDFQTVLPAGVQRGADLQAAELDVAVLEHAVEFSADGLEGVGGLGFAALFSDQLDRLGGDGVAADLVDQSHGDETVERLVALLDGGIQIAERREDVRPADDADDHGALAVAEIARGFSEIGLRGLLDAVGTGTEVDAVQIVGEDFVLGVAGLDTEGEGDFEELPVQRLLLHFEGIPGELHAQRGGSLGEVPVLDISNRRAKRARGHRRRCVRKIGRPRGRAAISRGNPECPRA